MNNEEFKIKGKTVVINIIYFVKIQILFDCGNNRY